MRNSSKCESDSRRSMNIQVNLVEYIQNQSKTK